MTQQYERMASARSEANNVAGGYSMQEYERMAAPAVNQRILGEEEYKGLAAPGGDGRVFDAGI